MLLGRDLEDLKAGTFRLECPSMRLSNLDQDDPQEFTGPGEIHLDADRRLALVVYDQNHQVDLARALSGGAPGVWLPRSELFDLEATDLRGVCWKAENLRPDTSGHVGRPGAIVRARIHTLATEGPAEGDGSDFVWLYFAERIETPANVSTITTIQESDEEHPRKGFRRDVWAIACGNLRIRVRRGETGFEMNVLGSAEEMPAGLDTRLEEALWFSLGQPLTADVVQYRRRDRTGVLVHSRRRSEKLSTAWVPYASNIIDAAPVLSELFCRYLAYVAKYDEERYHPLSVLIRKAVRAAEGTIEEEALALSVAIEGVLHHGFEHLGEAEADVVAAVKKLEALLEQHFKPSALDKRLDGFLKAVTRPSSRTALHNLQKPGVVTEEQVNAWERLRHVAAHGKEYSLPFREVYELTQQLRVLLNLLVFEIIGYSGPYTDYGAIGWPTRRAREGAGAAS